MIKEKKKKKVDKKKELIKELLGYLRTAALSFIAAAIFTILLSFHARSEMIKNLYVNKEVRLKFEQQIAKKIVEHSDFTKSLSDNNYSVCLQVGRLYETAGDYSKAEYAYYLAMQKAPAGIYTPIYKLSLVLIALDKLDEAEHLIESVVDANNLNLIKFKTRVYIVLGDKYYSVGKFLKASGYYEKANFYYSRLKKQDKVVQEAIIKRLVSSYTEAADVIVKNGYNSDAVRFLNKALNYDKNNSKIKYRLAIIYSDLDPVKSIEYFEPLLEKIPQDIDYNVYNKALMKAANIEDLQGNNIKAKYYRYKVHSMDLFINNKVIYKDDIDIFSDNIRVKKSLFKYKIYSKFKFQNNSAMDVYKLSADFILRNADKEKELITVECATKRKPLLSNGGEVNDISVNFGKNIYTKKELEHYYIDVYLYKDSKYKTLVATYKVPLK